LIDTGLRRDGRVLLSRDLALVIRKPLVRDRALAIQTRYRDPSALLSRGPRHLFAVPWRDVTLVGVNSIIYRDNPNALTVTQREVQGFLDEINQAQPALGLTPDDVALVLAGLLPISADSPGHGNISFGKRPLILDNARSDSVEGLITAITNRYTVARLVAERAVDLVIRKLGKSVSSCRTAETPLQGAKFGRVAELVHEVVARTTGQLEPDIAERLGQNHGSAYGDVLRVMTEAPQFAGAIGASQTLKAEVIHAIRAEMAVKLEDCVFRRTELGTAGDPGDDALEICARLMGLELGWNAERIGRELAEVRARFHSDTAARALAS
jgi:glycerol-3-phosphate dehydrogenase